MKNVLKITALLSGLGAALLLHACLPARLKNQN